MNDLERELRELGAATGRSIEPSPDLGARVLRRARTRRLVTAATGALTIGALALASAATVGAFDRPAAPPPAAPRPEDPSPGAPSLDFEPAKGWHVRTTDPGAAGDLGAQAWASNVPFAEDEEPVGEVNFFPAGWPDKTEDALPPDGILLVANQSLQTRNPLPPISDVPERSLPLTIDERPHTAIEGQQPDRAQAVVNAIVNDRYLSVRVVFGTADPPPELIREAEEELARLIVAPPPATTKAIHDFGIRMSVPEPWHRFLFRWAGTEPLLHAATVPITDLYDGSSARARLGPRDYFLVLSESYAYAARYEPVDGPVTIRPHDACPTCEILDNGTSPPPDHSLFYRSFSVDGRQFELFVEFGSAVPVPEDVALVNDALRTLEIGPPERPAGVETPRHVPRGDVAVDLPAGWLAKEDPVPGSSAPRVLAAYGTWDFPTGGDCGPEPALGDLPRDGGLVWVVEHLDPGNAGDFIPLLPGFSIDLQTPPARWECAAASPSRMYLFRVAGRYLEVHVALGPNAGAATVREAGSIVTSLRAD
ncbi:MAG: hypothetical protein M3271_03725 [Actinomycetota bacterium]|nr:hypothetical protein [Actinomycetota bacterium]